MRAAIVVPEAVEALVLLDTSADREPLLNRVRYRLMVTLARLVGMKPFLPIISQIVFGSTTRREQAELVNRWRKELSMIDIRSVRHGLDAVNRRDSVTPMLHEIDVPTLVIVGEQDVATPPDRSRTIAESIGGARLEVIPGAGHMTNLEQPELVDELIEEFLRSSVENGGQLEAVQDQPAEEADANEEPSQQDGETDEPVEESVDAAGENGKLAEETGVMEQGDGLPAEKPESTEGVEVADERLAQPADEPTGAVQPEGELVDYFPDEDRGDEEKERVLPGGKKGAERRGKRRVSPSRKLYGRIGHVGVLVVDLSESGARIEHYNRRFPTGSTITLEIEWEARLMSVESQVVSSRVHRFIPGDKGATVYQSGILFRRMSHESKEVLKELVNRLVTRGLAEQVANARGIGPVLQRDMPTFRSGVVNAGGRPKEAGSEGPSRLIRENPLTDQIGFIRCRKLGPRWERKWTLDPEQPREGFTILASENKLEIDMLCETWDTGDDTAKQFIRDCARMSIDAVLAEREGS